MFLNHNKLINNIVLECNDHFRNAFINQLFDFQIKLTNYCKYLNEIKNFEILTDFAQQKKNNK